MKANIHLHLQKTAAPAAKSGEDTSKGALEATENEGLSPIGVGDSLPSFTLPNEKGEDVDVSTLASEKGIVMFLVPKADTRKLFFEVLERRNHLFLCCSWLHQASMRLR